MDSSTLPIPMPRVKKRLSASFPEDEQTSSKNLNEARRKTQAEDVVQHGGTATEEVPNVFHCASYTLLFSVCIFYI